MARLSAPNDRMSEFYEAVVVGSGYGGGIAASRLARAGYRVAVLERGKEFQPGEYPDTLSKAISETQVNGPEVNVGPPTGLFDIRLNDDMNVLVASGLGGTSLLNANVSLEPDSRVFDDPCWPKAFRDDRLGRLREGYERARRMLAPVPYPDKVPLNKVLAMRRAGKALGHAAELPPINVTFEDRINQAGVFQRACTLCGDCCSGCNVGAKNTVLMNYLPDARYHGAEIFCEVGVRWIERDGERWRVHYRRLGPGEYAFENEELAVTARIVVIAAGSLGSTEILLRSKTKGLLASDKIGCRFSGNGDMLAFGYNNAQPIDGVGLGVDAVMYRPDTDGKRPPGPAIAGLIDLRAGPLEKGMVIEEGVIPGALAPILGPVMAEAAALTGIDTADDLRDRVAQHEREVASLVGGPYRGAVNHTQTLLVMAQDKADGRLVLRDDYLRVDWPGVGTRPFYSEIERRLKPVVAATAGTLVPNPVWTQLLKHHLITVHPLGGCAMAERGSEGAVDDACRVFVGDDDRVYDTLLVCDGSVMPRALGVNPLLTISAVSERAMMLLAEREGRAFDDKPVPSQPASPSSVPVVGVRFTERMAGWFGPSLDPGDFVSAAERGKALAPDAIGGRLSFIATIDANDLDRFIREPAHLARLTGELEAAALSPEPLMIVDGTFNLFVPDTAKIETKRMVYVMPLAAKGGRRYFLRGDKIIHHERGFDMWRETTTLYVTLHDGTDERAPVLGRGLLTIAVSDFSRQLRTIEITNAPSFADRVRGLAQFGRFFAGELFKSFGGALAPATAFNPDTARRRRDLRVCAPEIHFFDTKDGKKLRLMRYRGGKKGPVILSHGLGVSSLIFSIDTIDTNLLEYIYARGFDCWLLDYRASIDLPYCTEFWTADDVAENDYQAAVAAVLERTGAPSVQMVVHCFGAMTFFMAMLRGLQGVRSAAVSQIATDTVVPWFPQRLLAFLHMPSLLRAVGIKTVDARATTNRPWSQRLLDDAIGLFYPFHSDDRSHNLTSRRITVLYGQLYELSQLNEATFAALPEMFGEANIGSFLHLSRMLRKGHVVSADGKDIYLRHLNRLELPITFVHGELNRCWEPLGTQRTMDRLIRANGSHWYERHVIGGFGHIDCIFGKNAVDRVYPIIGAHLEHSA